MRIDLQPIQREILPLCEVHGVELVAIEWLLGPGRGILRIYIDRPGGDPRTPPDESRPGATADVCAHVSRDISAVLDELDVIDGAYDLEVGSPGFERPVQKRADFERFVGLRAKVMTRVAVEGQRNFDGVLAGVRGEDPEKYRVVLALGAKGEVEVPREQITRARLVEIKAEKPPKPGKGASKASKSRQAQAESTARAATTNESEGPLKAP